MNKRVLYEIRTRLRRASSSGPNLERGDGGIQVGRYIIIIIIITITIIIITITITIIIIITALTATFP